MTDAMTANPGDWPEDFEHENGNYSHHCIDCGGGFAGHKRRVICKVCAGKDTHMMTNPATHAADISMTHSEHTPVSVSHKTALPKTDDVAEAVERLEAYLKASPIEIEELADFHTLRASHEAQAAEIERQTAEIHELRSELSVRGSLLTDFAAELEDGPVNADEEEISALIAAVRSTGIIRPCTRLEVALSEHKAVLAEVTAAGERLRLHADLVPPSGRRGQPLDEALMLFKDALTRATALMEE